MAIEITDAGIITGASSINPDDSADYLLVFSLCVDNGAVSDPSGVTWAGGGLVSGSTAADGANWCRVRNWRKSLPDTGNNTLTWSGGSSVRGLGYFFLSGFVDWHNQSLQSSASATALGSGAVTANNGGCLLSGGVHVANETVSEVLGGIIAAQQASGGGQLIITYEYETDVTENGQHNWTTATRAAINWQSLEGAAPITSFPRATFFFSLAGLAIPAAMGKIIVPGAELIDKLI